MFTTLQRARAVAPALLLTLAACGQPHAESRFEAAQAAADPPQLWLVESLDGTRVKGEVMVCTDRPTREGFSRARAQSGGQPCLPFRDAVEKPGLYAVRCEMGGRNYGMTVNRIGDPDRDFTVHFALKALDGTGDAARQVRRFRRIGACPAGWRIGDQARPGEPPGSNALGVPFEDAES